jgi:hypothetical protein
MPSATCGDVRRRGVHHHLHHAEAGDEQAPQRATLLGAPLIAGRFGLRRARAVAQRLDRSHQIGHLQAAL